MKIINNASKFLSKHASDIEKVKSFSRVKKGIFVAINRDELVLSADLVKATGIKNGYYVDLGFKRYGAGVITMEFQKSLRITGSKEVRGRKNSDELRISAKSFIADKLGLFCGQSISKEGYLQFDPRVSTLFVALDDDAQIELEAELEALSNSSDDDVPHPDFA